MRCFNLNNQLISVIVPIYNVEKYLSKCLKSILNQSYNNIEIILVNDGSSDNSEKICEEFLNIDNRFILINQANSGLSQARNAGFKKSNGKYIIFIDSDDYIHSKMIDELYQQIITEKADVSICNITNVYSHSEAPQCSNPNIYYTTDTEGFISDYLIGEKIPGSICNKLIKREICEHLAFPKNKIYEDAFYQYDLLKYSKKFVINTKPRYFYYHRSNSITTKPFSIRDMDYIEIYTMFYELVIKKYPKLEEKAFFRLAYSYFFILDKLLTSPNYKENKEYFQILSFLKKNYFKIFKNKYFRKSRKIACLFLKLNVYLYKLLLIIEIKSNKNINK